MTQGVLKSPVDTKPAAGYSSENTEEEANHFQVTFTSSKSDMQRTEPHHPRSSRQMVQEVLKPPTDTEPAEGSSEEYQGDGEQYRVTQ